MDGDPSSGLMPARAGIFSSSAFGFCPAPELPAFAGVTAWRRSMGCVRISADWYVDAERGRWRHRSAWWIDFDIRIRPPRAFGANVKIIKFTRIK
jgi:hypothetical protein